MSKLLRRAGAVPDHPLSPAGSTYAILDANALLPPRLSDVLFDLRALYFPRWTADIETEFLRNWAHVVKRLKGAELKAYRAASPHPDDERKAEKRLNAYRNAVGDEYRLIGYSANHISKQVPAAVNKGDIHVAQAAILMRHLLASEGMVCDRIFLVSSNVKHLAAKDMEGLGIEVIRPGAFVDLLFQAAQDRVSEALEQTVCDLTSPPYTKGDLLGSLSLNPAVGRLLPQQTLYESNTCAHDGLHLRGESAARPQVCRFRPLALLLAPPGQAVRGALAPSQRPASSAPRPRPNAGFRLSLHGAKAAVKRFCKAWSVRLLPGKERQL